MALCWPQPALGHCSSFTECFKERFGSEVTDLSLGDLALGAELVAWHSDPN